MSEDYSAASAPIDPKDTAVLDRIHQMQDYIDILDSTVWRMAKWAEKAHWDADPTVGNAYIAAVEQLRLAIATLSIGRARRLDMWVADRTTPRVPDAEWDAIIRGITVEDGAE